MNPSQDTVQGVDQDRCVTPSSASGNGYNNSDFYGMSHMYHQPTQQPQSQSQHQQQNGPPGFNWQASIYQAPQHQQQQQFSSTLSGDSQWQQNPLQGPSGRTTPGGYMIQTGYSHPPAPSSHSPISFDGPQQHQQHQHQQLSQTPQTHPYQYPYSQHMYLAARQPSDYAPFERTDSPQLARQAANASPANLQPHYPSHSPLPMAQQHIPTPPDVMGYPPRPSSYQRTINPQFLQHQFYNTTQADIENAPRQPTATEAQTASRPASGHEPSFSVQIPARQIHPSLLAPSLALAPSTTSAQVPAGTAAPALPAAASAKVKAPRKKKDPNAPKAPRKKKAAAAPADAPAKEKKNGASSVSSSGSDSDSELEIEMAEAFPLPGDRPKEEDVAAKYDAVKAVWYPRNRDPKAEDVRNALQNFATLVRSIRDSYKKLGDSMKSAHVLNQEVIVTALSNGMSAQRRKIEIVINAALEFGHPALVERLGENPFTLAVFYTFLVDRHSANDSDGSLTSAILRLMSKFSRMDQAMLEKTKNDKILSRLSKKGGSTIKSLAIKVLANASIATKNKAQQAAAPARESPPAVKPQSPKGADQSNFSVVITKQTQPIAGAKRALEADSDGPASKKATTASKATAAVKRAISTSQDIKAASKQAVAEKKTPIVATNTVPKASASFMASLLSASKKPGTSNAERAAAAKVKPTTEKKVTSAPAPKPAAFSFSDTMALLGTPQKVEAPEKVEEVIDETEEEKAKRLRKEERRKLRVTWRPDDELCQIRLFTHAPEEDRGHDDSMMKDAGDVRSEGRMLKMHKDIDMDDAEDEEVSSEVSFSDYSPPRMIDFGEVEDAEKKKNYFKFGGLLSPDSPERIAQDQRELTTLMVVHTTSADVPDTPKEAPASDGDVPPPELIPFGEPDDKTKARAERYYAAMAPQTTQQYQAPPAAAPTPDISSLLQMLRPQQQQAPQQPQTPAPNFLSFLQPGANLAPQAPPAAPGIPDNLAQIVAMFTSGQQQQTQPVAVASAPAPPVIAPNLAQLLASMGGLGNSAAQPQTQTQQAPHHQSSNSDSSYNPPEHQTSSYNINHSHNNNSSSDAQSSNPYNEERKRAYSAVANNGGLDYDDVADDTNDNNNVNGFNNGNVNGNGHDWHHNKRAKGAGKDKKKHSKYQLLPCRYFNEGKCRKGNDCTYRHDSK